MIRTDRYRSPRSHKLESRYDLLQHMTYSSMISGKGQITVPQEAAKTFSALGNAVDALAEGQAIDC